MDRTVGVIDQEPTTLVLDTSCLFGVHRLLRVITRPFDKLILPPDVAALTWPKPVELWRFAGSQAVSAEIASGDDVSWQGRLAQLTDTVKREYDTMLELLDELERIGRLERPDYNSWLVDDQKPSPQWTGRPDFMKDLYNPLLLDYISLPDSKKKGLRLQVADLTAVAVSVYRGHEMLSFNPAVSDYLLPAGKARMFEAQDRVTFPCHLRTRDLESYLDFITGSHPAKAEMARAFGVSTFGSTITKSLLVAAKEEALGWLGPVGTLISAGAEILSIIGRHLKNRQIGRIQTHGIRRVDPGRAALMEQIWDYIMGGQEQHWGG
jgi:hypothetical protein